MTVKELMALLAKQNPRNQVAILNLADDSDDGGVYPKVGVCLMGKADIPDGCKPWVAITFSDPADEA